jgi:phosphoglucosamine mutase
LINVDVKSKPDLKGIPEITTVVEEVEKELGSEGRVLVRYSGTQPMCRVMIEGPTIEKTKELATKIAAVVKKKLN